LKIAIRTVVAAMQRANLSKIFEEMSKKSYPKLLTTENFHALHGRHGFTQAEAGAAELFNEALVAALTKVTKQAMLQAEHSGRTGLNGEMAKKGIEMTREIPAGLYGQ